MGKRIAQFIVAERANKPIETTGELVDVIKKAVPKGARKDGPHPAKRTFQAIRIELNRELEVLKDSLDDMIDLLNPGGRLCIITFHSLEDRMVKNFMKTGNVEGRAEQDFFGRINAPLRPVNNKVIVPDEAEIERNPRSRSAKLRIAEKV